MITTERAPRSFPASRGIAIVVLASLGVVGCGDSSPESGSVDATTPGCPGATSPVIEVTGPMAAFDLGGVAEPIRLAEKDGYLVEDALADGTIPDLLIKFDDIVQAAGFDIAGSESEDFDGEVFFAKGDVAAGQVLLRKSDCEGVVDVSIKVLDDPSLLPSGTASTTS